MNSIHYLHIRSIFVHMTNISYCTDQSRFGDHIEAAWGAECVLTAAAVSASICSVPCHPEIL